jgi:cytochrome b pre-mRNA-processing protein 3
MALSLGGFYSTESTNQRAADRLYAAITAQCDGEAFARTFEIERSFRGEHSALVLHVWLVLRRLREEGESGKALAQTLYDTFQDDVEHRVHAEGVRVRVNKWLNELEQGFYGSALAYDNALTGGQGDLAKVLHRNVFHGEDDASNARAQRLERYVRLTLGCLAATDGKAVREGRVRFSGVEL